MNNDWLKELKEGDSVLVQLSGPGKPRIEIIERVTPTQIVLPGNRRFNKADGWARTGIYGRRARIVRPAAGL